MSVAQHAQELLLELEDSIARSLARLELSHRLLDETESLAVPPLRVLGDIGA